MRSPVLALVFFCGFSGALTAEPGTPEVNLIANPEFKPGLEGRPANWSVWSPRAELTPATAVATQDGTAVLSVRANRYEDFGEWVALVSGIAPGKFYRFEVAHRAKNVEAESVSVVAQLAWLRQPGDSEEIQRDYADRVALDGKWRRDFRTLQAPADAHAVKIRLGLRWSAQGEVVWKAPRLVEIAPPPPRKVRVVTTRIAPGAHSTVAANTRLMLEMLDRAGPQQPDVVLFSENLVDRAARLPLAEAAQPIPGPLTAALAEKARKYHTYVITTLHERAGGLYYNTAVLIDREGRIAGKYRKVHLAIAEADGGLTPGSEYPVFETDFGRIGILICWDNWFQEPARILRLKGAEMLFLPLAGDGSDGHWQAVSRARAMDNGLYFVSSGTVSDASAIINPNGEVVGEARGNFACVVSDLDLGEEWRQRYLSVGSGRGEARSLYLMERRPDTYGELTADTTGRANAGGPPAETKP